MTKLSISDSNDRTVDYSTYQDAGVISFGSEAPESA